MRPRLTEAVAKALYTLLNAGAERIAFIPDSPYLKDDLEGALEFILTMHSLRGIGDTRDMFEQGFGVVMRDLSGFVCFNDATLLKMTQRFIFVAGKYGINAFDSKYLDGFVVFNQRELESIVGMTTNTLFSAGRDINGRVVLVEQVSDNGKCYEVGRA